MQQVRFYTCIAVIDMTSNFVGFDFACKNMNSRYILVELAIKFIYSEKATKFCEISTNYLSYVNTASWLIGGDFAKFCGLLRIYELYHFSSTSA